MSLDENGSGFACTSRTLSSLPSEPLSTTNASMQLEQQATGTSSLKRPRDESSSLSSSEGSRKHMRISRAHLCQWRSCSEGFETVAALRVHAHQHSWAEPACQWGTCSKPFDSLATLNKHLDTHIRPFSCSRCSHRTATRRDLARHVQSHGVVINNEAYYCPSSTCPYRQGGHKRPFGRQDNAKRHISKQHLGMSMEPIRGALRT
ncbi:hypothetical protein BDZ45DRAFT_297345 [Acephala macrosclerotiorum]|nr:hypothetical protein BDZ45DRAFT_297345 [Acephala macrosclerotiorum]